MGRPELGTKRVCGSCGTKYYDLNRDPILCPKCGTAFVIAAPVLAATAAPMMKSPIADEVAVDLIDPNVELISLEDLEAEVDGKDAAEVEEDDTFLEEEEDDTDVSDFIDGDIENEDEQ